MGGMKNKLSSKLGNKTIPLSDSRLTSPFSQRGTIEDKQSLPLSKEEKRPAAFRVGTPLASQRCDDIQMSVAHRWGHYTKYLSLACLSLAILSTLILNIVSSYSSSSTQINATDSSTNGEPVVQSSADPTSIALSISSSPSSSSTGGNDANLSLSIPQGGGIATGRHTITVETGSDIIGYDLILSSNSEETNIVINGLSDSSDATIAPTWGSPSIAPSQITNNTYGYTTQNVDNDNMLVYANVWYGLPPASKPNTIASVDLPLTDNANTTISNVYWAVRVNNPESMLAGDYAADVVYTVVAELMPEPEVDSATPNVYKIDPIKKIQLVGYDLYALMSSGVVYSYSSYGRLTNFFEFGDRIIDFASADQSIFSSMVFTTNSNQVYSFGKNNYGQLGDGTTVDAYKSSPVNITSNFGQTVKKVFAGDYYYGALTEDGHVYMWGYGEEGNLGTGNSNNQATPIDITANFSAIDGGIINIVPAHDFRSAITFALTDTGHVYGWGNGRNGALGTGKDQYEYYPVDITPNFNLNSGETIIQVAADSGNGNYGHGLALTDRGRVFTWGDNRDGELGDGSTTDSYLPKDITGNFELVGDDKIISVGAGVNRSYAVSANGVVYRWGGGNAMIPTVISGDGRFVNMNTDNITYAIGYRPSTFLLDGNNNVYTVSSSTAGQNITDEFMVEPLATLTGSNFTNVNNVYIDLNTDGTMQSNEQCTDLTVNSDTELTCNVPTDNNIATGDYTMYIETPYNYTTTTFKYENYGE